MMTTPTGSAPRRQTVFWPPADIIQPVVISASVGVREGADASEAFALIGEIGPVTADALGRALCIDESYARAWLRWQTQLDYLQRDEFGRYANFCAIPRSLY